MNWSSHHVARAREMLREEWRPGDHRRGQLTEHDDWFDAELDAPLPTEQPADADLTDDATPDPADEPGPGEDA